MVKETVSTGKKARREEKKSSSYLDFSSDTPHCENKIPSGWSISTLGNLFTLQAGKNITSSDIQSDSSDFMPYPCYGGNGIRGYIKSYNRSGEYPIIGRQGALCGNINLAQGVFYATEHAVVVERYSNTDLMWAYYTLIALNLNQYATATAQPGISVSTINDVNILVPPIAEQRRISKAITHWFSLIEQIEKGKIELLTFIKQTKSKILDLAIQGKLIPQDPSDEPASELLKRINPKAEIACDNAQYPNKWCLCRLSDVCTFENGFAFSSNNYKSEGIPLVRISNITDNKIDLSNCVFIQEEVNERFFISYGDLLIAMSGATTGKMGIYNSTDRALLNQRVGNIKIKNQNILLPAYRNLYMQSTVNKILSLAYGGAQPNISSSVICNFEFPLPPLAEQQRIVAKIEELFSQLDQIEKSLEA